MSVETMIQVAIVRADMAVCAIGRALVGFAAVAACVGVIVICWRVRHVGHQKRRS